VSGIHEEGIQQQPHKRIRLIRQEGLSAMSLNRKINSTNIYQHLLCVRHGLYIKKRNGRALRWWKK
jgi:hypothetical protein